MAPNPEFPAIAWAGPASSGRSRIGLGPYRYVTWHCTGNPDSNAYGEAAWARNRTDGIGTHTTADASICLQVQNTALSVGHVGSGTGNRYGIALELCGVDDDSAAHWRPIIDRCVPFVRLVMAKYRIANRWLTIAEMRDGHSTGHITHDMARIAWGGTDHTDPGPNFPKTYVISAVAGLSAAAPQTGDDDMQTLVRYSGDPTGAVFLTNFITAKWVKNEAEVADYVTLGGDGSMSLGHGAGPGWEGHVRVLGRRELIGVIVGEVPAGWEDRRVVGPVPVAEA